MKDSAKENCLDNPPWGVNWGIKNVIQVSLFSSTRNLIRTECKVATVYGKK